MRGSHGFVRNQKGDLIHELKARHAIPEFYNGLQEPGAFLSVEEAPRRRFSVRLPLCPACDASPIQNRSIGPVNIPAFVVLFIFILGLAQSKIVSAGGVQSGNMAPIASGAKTDGGKPLDYNSEKVNAQIINDPNYDECGQDCLLGKANENLSLQYQYYVKKLSFLNSDIDPPSGNSAQLDEYDRKKAALDQQKWDLLGSFCVKEPVPEQLDECIDRYKQTQDLWVAKVRFALAKNEENHGKLTSVDDGVRTVQRSKSEGEPSKQSQMPFLSESGDLGGFTPSTNAASVNERGTLDTLEPVASEYVMIDKIPRDPSNPSKGDFYVVKMKNGKPVLDDKAYKAALAEWKGGGVMEGISAKFKEKNKKLSQQIKEDQQRFAKEFSRSVPKDQRSIARKIYDDARGEYIHAINGGQGSLPSGGAGNNPTTPQNRIQNNYAPSQSFPGPNGGGSAAAGNQGRSVAGGSNYTPGQYSGDEQVKEQQGTQVYVRNVANQLHMNNVQLLTPEQQAQLAKGQPNSAQPQGSTVATPAGATNQSNGQGTMPAGTTTVPQSPYTGNSMSMDQFLHP